jgi:glycosyltransferase involved in cell wall biosynthesis
MPIRIVHYSPGMRFELGGVVRAVMDWCSVLARRGNEVILVTYHSTDLPEDWDGRPGKPRVVWIAPAKVPNWLVPGKSVKIWDELMTPGSVAHLHCPWTASNIQMARSARSHGVPYLVSIHGMLNDWPMRHGRMKKRIFLAAGGRRYLCLADRLHYTAEAEREQAEKWVPGSRSVVLPLMMDLAPFRQLPGPEIAKAKFKIGGEAPTLLFLSRLHEQKGVDVLLDAAALLRGSGRSFRLIIAGIAAVPAAREYEKGLHEQAKRLELDDCVQFVGLVTGVEKISLYQAADLFVLPTRHENVGLVLIEAMASGTPVLTTRGTNVWREIEGGGGAIGGDSPRQLCEAIGRLLDDRAALSAAGQRGRAWAMERFDSEKLAEEYEGLYARIIEERKKL